MSDSAMCRNSYGERPGTQISRYYPTSNISNTVQDRAILTHANHDLSNDAILSDLE